MGIGVVKFSPVRAVLLGLVALACLSSASPAAADPGRTTKGVVTSNGNDFEYILYTPSTYRARRDSPLVVMVHGCGTTAKQQMEVSQFNRLAERKSFVVLYPDVDEVGRNLPGPLKNCWKFPDPTSYFRGTGDAAAIADMTRFAMDKRSIDDERVYLAGISAGGLMTSIEAAAYPDLYAAVSIMSSAGYADGPCFTTGVGIPAEASALLAHTVMGSYARVVPRMVLGGDADLAFPWHCTNKALLSGLRTNNLVLSGTQTGPISLDPASVSERQKAGGRQLHGQPLPRCGWLSRRRELADSRHGPLLVGRHQGSRLLGIRRCHRPAAPQGLRGRSSAGSGSPRPARPAPNSLPAVRVMGIVNVTPDSFSDGGLYLDADAAIAHGRELAADGADVLDVGGESTRPGAAEVAGG